MHPDPLAHPDLPSRSSTKVPHRDRFHAPPSPRPSLSRRRGRGSRTSARPGQGRHARQGVLKNEKRKLRCASGRSPKGEARETAREARAEPAIPMPPPEDVFLMREREAPRDPHAPLAPGAFFAARVAGFPMGLSSRVTRAVCLSLVFSAWIFSVWVFSVFYFSSPLLLTIPTQIFLSLVFQRNILKKGFLSLVFFARPTRSSLRFAPFVAQGIL